MRAVIERKGTAINEGHTPQQVQSIRVDFFFTVVEMSAISRHNLREELAGITWGTPVNVGSTIHLQWQILNFFVFYLLATLCCRPDVCSSILGQLEFFHNRALS